MGPVTGVMLPQAKEYQQPPEMARNASSLRASGRIGILLTL